MTPQELLSILSVSAKLKLNTRHCFTAPDRKESVADHSWRLALTAMLLWFFYYLFLCLKLVGKLAGTPYAPIPCGLFGGLFVCYLQSCLEWVLRQQINLILLMIFFAMLDYLNANWRSIKRNALETAVVKPAK